MQNQSIGFVAFGKRDGFELLFKGGNLEAFQSQEHIDILSQIIQLKLEEIRIFPGAEILGAMHFKHQGNWYKVFTLYRYTLDVYKRDGYYAGAVIIQNGTVNAKALLPFLTLLSKRAKKKILNEPYSSEFSVPEVLPDLEPRYIENEEKSAFIPFAINDSELFEEWFVEMLTQKRIKYQLTFASGSNSVIEHFDKARVAEIKHSKFSPKPKPIPVLATGNQAQEVELPSIKEDSMIYEFEIADDDRWAKKTVPSRRTKSKIRKNNSLLESPKKLVLAVGIAIGLIAGIIFFIG